MRGTATVKLKIAQVFHLKLLSQVDQILKSDPNKRIAVLRTPTKHCELNPIGECWKIMTREISFVDVYFINVVK